MPYDMINGEKCKLIVTILKMKCISLVSVNGRTIVVIIVMLYPTSICLWIQLLPTNKNNKDNGYISAECNVIIQIYIKNKEMFCFVTLCWKRRRGIFHINQRKWYFLSKCGMNDVINSSLYISRIQLTLLISFRW